jgi:single-strand DNA-binding protein
MNQVTLFGRVGRDPETRAVGSTEVCQVSLATSSRWKDKQSGEYKERTEWHRIEAWGGTAKALARVSKGDRLLVTGELCYNEWTDKDGAKRTTASVKIADLTFIDRGEGGGSGGGSGGGDRPKADLGERRQQAPAPPMTGNGGGFADDDIPF